MDEFTRATIETYDRTAEQYAKNVANLAHEEIIGTFLEHLPADTRILDLGCGSGRDAKIFSERGYRVVGIDLSERLIEIAMAEAPRARFRVMDIRRLEFKNESFGGIYAVASVLHLPKKDVPQCMAECSRVLVPSGVIYVSVKKRASAQEPREEFRPDLRYDDKALKFYSYFDEGEIESYLEAAGFEILSSASKETFKHYLAHNEMRVLARKK